MFGLSLVTMVFLVMSSIWGLRRRGGTEAHSVQEYRHTMDTLQGIRGRSGDGSVKVTPSTPTPERHPLVRVAGRPEAGADGGGAPVTGPPRAPGAPRGQLHREQRAMSAMNHGPRHLFGPTVAVVLVVAILVALLAVGAHSRNHPGHPSTTTVTTVHRHDGRHGGRGAYGGRAHGTGHPPTTTTTTTLPSRYEPNGTTADSASYVPQAATYKVVVKATTSRCWVEAAGANGSVVFAEALAAGQSHTLQTTGDLTISLGAPAAVSVTMDGRPVVLPSALTSPFLLDFQPPAVATTTTTAPASTSTTATTAG